MKSYQKFFLSFILLIALFEAIFLETAFASADPITKLNTLANRIFNITLAIGTSLAVLMLMFGGFIWLTSLGNPEQIKQAKQRIFSALIGLLILISSTSLLALFGIGPGDWLLEAIGIDIPEQELLEQVEIYPRFCAEINLETYYNNLNTFLNQRKEEAKSLIKETTLLAGRAGHFVSSAERQCNAMHGSWAKCVEPHRKAQFAKCVQEAPFYDPDGEYIRDGCPLGVREQQDELRKQNKKARTSLNNFREVIKKTIDSEEVKKVKVILEKLHHCQMNEETILYTHAQAKEKGIIEALDLDTVDFYCCTRD